MCSAVWFVRFSYYKTANRTAPCDVVRCCGAMRYTITCGAIQLCHFTGSFSAVFAVW